MIKKTFISFFISVILTGNISFTIINATEVVDPFKVAEAKFVKDIGNKVHEKEKGRYANSKNKCEYSISNVARGFAKMESGIGTEGMSIPTNNWTSLHPASRAVFYFKWDGKSTMSKGETIRKYGSVEDGLYDFMYMYKYFYNCNVSYPMILTYIYGFGEKNATQHAHARYYYNNLVYFINKYENTTTFRNIALFQETANDFKSGLSKKGAPKATADNKCSVDIAKIAYAYHVASNQSDASIKDTKNLYGMSKFKNPRMASSINKKGLAVYDSERKSVLDFMHAYKFDYGCKVNKDTVKKWFYGNEKVSETELIAKTDEIKNIISND